MSEHDAGLPEPSEAWAMFLDVDGTLMEYAADPDAVRATEAQLARLARLRVACGGALAIVSGRRIADVDRVFGSATGAVAGQHGAERRDAAGALQGRARESASFLRARDVLSLRLARHRELILEDKGQSLALHYRTAPSLEALAHSMMRLAQNIAGEEYSIQTGNCVVELKPRGVNKGMAIRDFMGEAPFAGRRPVFIGDDVTDEDGFIAVNALGGYAIKVGAGETRAKWRIAGVAALAAWLDMVTRTMEAGPSHTRSDYERATAPR